MKKIMIKATLLGIALVIAVASAAPAALTHSPVPSCDLRENVIELLARKYGEAPVAVGLTGTGGLIEVLTTKDGKTWTIIVTRPNGTSCMVAEGEGWRQLETKPEAGGEPS